MVTHQSALISISDFFLSSEVMTMRQTDGAAHKLKPRLFYKSAHLQVHPVDFYSGMNHAWQVYILYTYGRHIDIRVGLFIISIDNVY